MLCSKCGNANPDHAAYCSACGSPLTGGEKNAAAPQGPQGPEDRGELPPPPAPPVRSAPASALSLDARRRKLTPGQMLVMAAGVLMFIWGFLDWYSSPGQGFNAWSANTIPGLVLTATWVPLLSLAIAVLVGIRSFGSGLPDRVWGFSWAQLSVVVGLFDVLITFGFLVANRSVGGFGSLNLGVGLILSFITALVMLAGAILDQAGVGAGTSGESTKTSTA